MDVHNTQTDTQAHPKLPLASSDQKPGAFSRPDECQVPDFAKREQSGPFEKIGDQKPRKTEDHSHTGKCKCSVL
jgi:hypothetical protein